MQPKHKNKNRNVAGRRGPAMATMIQAALVNASLSGEELGAFAGEIEDLQSDEHGRLIISKDKLPAGITAVETLTGHWLFKDERLSAYKTAVAAATTQFRKDFFSEEGASVIDLRRDKKNRVWGQDGQVLGLAYLAIAMGLGEWSYPREEWAGLEDKMPHIRFYNLDQPTGETNGQTSGIEEQAGRNE